MPEPLADRPSVLIVGAGIAGLTLAAALRGDGRRVGLVERAPALAPVGAGITLQPNASAVLQALGVHLPDDDVGPIGPVEVHDARGRPLMRMDAGALSAGLAPAWNVHRADLHRALLAAAGRAPTLGRELVGITRPPGGGPLGARFSDGPEEPWDLIVGADGLRSGVRRALRGDAGCRLVYSGYTCWRFSAPTFGHPLNLAVEHWGPGRRSGLVPLSRDRVYVYLVDNAPEGTPGPGTGCLAAVRARFGGLRPDLDALLARCPDDLPVHHGDIHEHAEIDFGEGPVVLIGDAAHAMTPNLGQGGGTAIEDAVELALLLRRGAPVDGLAEALAARRRDRVAAVKTVARQIGAAAHHTPAWLRPLRDLALRVTPAALGDRQTRAMWAPGLALAASWAASAAEAG